MDHDSVTWRCCFRYLVFAYLAKALSVLLAFHFFFSCVFQKLLNVGKIHLSLLTFCHFWNKLARRLLIAKRLETDESESRPGHSPVYVAAKQQKNKSEKKVRKLHYFVKLSEPASNRHSQSHRFVYFAALLSDPCDSSYWILAAKDFDHLRSASLRPWVPTLKSSQFTFTHFFFFLDQQVCHAAMFNFCQNYLDHILSFSFRKRKNMVANFLFLPH